MTSIVGGLGSTRLGASEVEHSSQHGHQLRLRPVLPTLRDMDHMDIRDAPGTPTRAYNGGALVDLQVDNSEIIFYKHDDDDEERSPPEWNSEEELSDLDP